jgi:hypothetical protein
VTGNNYGIHLQADNNTIKDNIICYNTDNVYNNTATNTIENNTFCVDRVLPLSIWYSSINTFTFNASTLFSPTNCQLYVDNSFKGTNTSVYHHNSTNISYSPSSGSHTWNVTCNDTYNNRASSFYSFGIVMVDGSACSSNGQCINGHCVHSVCRSAITYCGDSHCDTGEYCDACVADCGACPGGSVVEPGGSSDTTIIATTTSTTVETDTTNPSKPQTSTIELTIPKIEKKVETAQIILVSVVLVIAIIFVFKVKL